MVHADAQETLSKSEVSIESLLRFLARELAAESLELRRKHYEAARADDSEHSPSPPS